jgi:hypothetical protein
MSHKGSLYGIQHQVIPCAVCGKDFTVNAGHTHPVCSTECSTAYRYAEHFPHLKQMAYEYEWLGWGLRTLARKYDLSTKKVSRLLEYTGIRTRPNNSRGWSLAKRRAFSRGSTSWDAIQGQEIQGELPL